MNFSLLKLIIQREYLNKVRNKVFIISTLLAPLGLVAIIVAQIIATAYTKPEPLNLGIVDETTLISQNLPRKEKNFTFTPLQGDINKNLTYIQGKNPKFNGIIYIPKQFSIKGGDLIYYGKNTLSVGNHNKLEDLFIQILKNQQLIQSGIRPSQLDSIQAKVNLSSVEVSDKGDIKQTNSFIRTFVGFGASLLLYMFLFIYGAIVLRIVIEEKTNRVIEVLLTCVKPIDLLISKIIAVLLVGLTQIGIWLGLIVILGSIISPMITKNTTEKRTRAEQQVVEQQSIDPASMTIQNSKPNLLQALYSTSPMILLYFVLYFIGGYLFYGSLFAAIGAAVDNESDTQYLQLPITLPVIIPILFTGHILENPNSGLSRFLSYFPMTSPMTMLTRFNSGKVEWWEITLSLILLYLSVFAALWIAAKIYRVGILMYGKKASYKELWKWLKMS
ncbi:MAG: ABC transporter permease [Bacteroidia bacterium]|nr:ABC transporter permease [Bacteroidia bacterium]MDW8347268.1 ABC transporter permease [Bacteroidia bacterium]